MQYHMNTMPRTDPDGSLELHLNTILLNILCTIFQYVLNIMHAKCLKSKAAMETADALAHHRPFAALQHDKPLLQQMSAVHAYAALKVCTIFAVAPCW
jgi:hypothetical protein